MFDDEQEELEALEQFVETQIRNKKEHLPVGASEIDDNANENSQKSAIGRHLEEIKLNKLRTEEAIVVDGELRKPITGVRQDKIIQSTEVPDQATLDADSAIKTRLLRKATLDAIVGPKGEKYHEIVAFIESMRLTNKKEYINLLKHALVGREKENQQMTERQVAPIVIAFNGEQPQRDKVITINQ